MGGGFGRRSNVGYVEEAVHIAKALPGTPVKLTWTREDDMRRGPFRPASYLRFSGAVDEQGWPAAFTARIVCPSFFRDGGDGGDGVDHMAVQGVDTLPYAIPHLLVEHHKAETGVPTFFWRSVGYSQNT